MIQEALKKWYDLTGITPDQTTFRLGDFDVLSMNKAIKDALDLEPSGITAHLLLECFLRAHLEEKTFTVAQIMKDYPALSRYLAKAEELFSIVQSDEVVEATADFKARVKKGVDSYKAGREDVFDMIEHPNHLAFLRRDALHAMNNLSPFQFLAGPHDDAPAQVIEHVYQAWDINALLRALRDMPVSGIAVVLLRDPSHPDRSYFCFAMRNGQNVTLFTDKNRPAYPGQEDNFRSRGAGRTFVARAWANHFPYQLIKTHHDERGDVVFEAETAPVIAGQDLVPLMRIQDLPAHQIIWLTMMLSLLSEKFWKKKWQAQDLSYTGAMVENKTLLVTQDGQNLPAAQGYIPLGLESVRQEDITRDHINDQFERTSRVNAWLEERYGNDVSEDVLNQWSKDPDTLLMLPKRVEKDDFKGEKKPTGTQLTQNVLAYSKRELEKTPFWNKPSGYELQTHSPTAFGTEAQLKEDRLWIARYNQAQFIQRAADEEYHARKDEIKAWYEKALINNQDAILARLAKTTLEIEQGNTRADVRLTFGQINDSIWDYTYSFGPVLGRYSELDRHQKCVLDDTKATWKAVYSPRTVQDLSALVGLDIADLPDVLQHWNKDKDYVGNDILDRLDPVETKVKDPWLKLELNVTLFLSKRALTRLQKRART